MAQSYCSLMEAYNVPSFDPPRRKKGCVVDPSDIKASSVPFEPYQDSSKEQAMWANGVGGGSKVARARVNTPPMSSIENFEGLDGAGAGASGRSPPMPKYYSGYQQDKDFYCKAYNVCPETFTSSRADNAELVPQPPVGQKVKATGGKAPSCSGPLQPPRYEYPMTPEARSAYDKALDLSMNQETGSTPFHAPKPLPPNQGDVNGYSEEDLDRFLKTNDMKSVPFDLPKLPKNAQNVDGRDPYASHFAESMKDFTRNGVPKLRPENGSDYEYRGVKQGSNEHVDPWDKVWDMALFIVAGLLLILLLEQLFKLAMLYGMKRAILAIEPLLANARSE